MKSIFFLLMILPAPSLVVAQSSYVSKQADKAFHEMRYADAIDYYTTALKRDSSDMTARKQLAESYYLTQQYRQALAGYEVIVTANQDSLTLTRYAQLLALTGQYQQAAAALDRLQATGFSDQQTQATARLYTSGLADLMRDSARTKVQLLNISSGYADFSPVLHRYGLLFISDRPLTTPFRQVNGWNGGNFLRIFAMRDTALIAPVEEYTKGYQALVKFEKDNPKNMDNNLVSSSDSRQTGVDRRINYSPPPRELSLKEVTLFDKRLNGAFHTGPVAFNTRQDTMYLTTNGKRNSKGVSPLRLLIYKASHDTWTPITPFPYNSPDYNTGLAAAIPGSGSIVFTSDMPGGYGGKDIYFSTLTDTGWSSPRNAGPMVNTAGNEMFPYVTEDHTLYFSSDHWPGLGGLDIFYTRLSTSLTPVEEPFNAGAPINSSRNDFGIILWNAGRQGCFSSDRRGNDDIYSISR